MFRIRFHGRGGQGMKTAGQILGTSFFLEGLEVQDAPRYGAERRGAPIFAYVRADHGPIQERGVIARPDLVIVADETLVPVPAAGVLQGVTGSTVMLVCSPDSADSWRQRLALAGTVLTLPALAWSEQRAAPAPVGAQCAGAAARLVGVVKRETLTAAIRAEISRFGEVAVQRNLEQALAAYDAMTPHAGAVAPDVDIGAADYSPPQWIDLPFDPARVSAPDIHASANSELVATGLWRTLRPVIDYPHCNRCSWICSTFCPDSAIQVGAGHMPRVDYDHCKGCMICVAVCPPHAIRAVPEHAAQEAAG